MKSLLHVVNSSFVIPYFFGNQLNYFKEKGVKIYLVCNPSEHFFKLKDIYSFEVIPLKIFRKVNLYHDLKSIVELYIILKKIEVNIVIGHTPKGAFIAMFSSFLANIKRRIYFRHGFYFESSSGFKRFFLILIEKLTSFCSTEVIAVSRSVYDKSKLMNLNSQRPMNLILNGSCNGVDSSNIYNPKKIKEIDKESLRAKHFISENDFVIGYVGRILKDKGINELVNSFIVLQSQYDNIKLLLIGPLERNNKLDRRVLQEIESNKSIIWTNYKTSTNVYYSIMDIFVLPSYREGFPTVILEASSMGLPIITSKSTGCIDSIIDFETGEYCEISKNQIKEKIENLILNKKLRNFYGNNGRSFVVKNFNQEAIWKELGRIYGID